MSKLIERLEKVGTTTPTRIGFGANRASDKTPSMLLVALAAAKSEASALKLKADSFIIASEKSTKAEIEGAKKAAGEALWGLWTEILASDSLEVLKQQGGDFFVVSSFDSPAEVLADEELGKLMAVPAEFPEELGYSMGGIPVDAVILTGLEESSPLSVKDVLQARSVREVVLKPVLLLRSKPLGEKELAVLQDVGIQGVVADLRSMKVEDAVQMKAAIDALPPRKVKRDQASALLPRLSTRSSVPQREEDDDDDDDDDPD